MWIIQLLLFSAVSLILCEKGDENWIPKSRHPVAQMIDEVRREIDQQDRIPSEEFDFKGFKSVRRVNRELINEKPSIREEHEKLNEGDRFVYPQGYGSLYFQVFIWGTSGNCTASLIHPWIVLSAGHCLSGQTVHELRIFKNPSDTCRLNYNNGVRALETVFLYDGVVYTSTTHDIGFIVTRSNMGSYHNILWYGINAGPHYNIRGFGYGVTYDSSGQPIKPCTSLFGDFVQMTCPNDPRSGRFPGYQWLCVRPKAADKRGGSCDGDSGGPWWSRSTSGYGRVVALTSGGHGPCGSYEYGSGFDFNTNLAYYHSYIRDTVVRLENKYGAGRK